MYQDYQPYSSDSSLRKGNWQRVKKSTFLAFSAAGGEYVALMAALVGYELLE
jgi:hypothetical protein